MTMQVQVNEVTHWMLLFRRALRARALVTSCRRALRARAVVTSCRRVLRARAFVPSCFREVVNPLPLSFSLSLYAKRCRFAFIPIRWYWEVSNSRRKPHG